MLHAGTGYQGEEATKVVTVGKVTEETRSPGTVEMVHSGTMVTGIVDMRMTRINEVTGGRPGKKRRN
jgi:hypothetical protein